MTAPARRPRVVVVGGGYGGRAVARALDADTDVTLVTEREAFLHNVAALRAVAAPDRTGTVLIGYHKLLRHGRVLTARASSIDDTGATLDDGTRVDGDYVVVATGSTYPFPGKPSERTRDHLLARFRRTRSAVDAATGVLILGAGPVGLELAGELAAARPGLPITVLERGPVLLPGPYRDRLRDRLQADLRRVGVQVIVNDSVDLPSTVSVDGHLSPPTTLTTRGGRRLTADLVFTAYGAAPRNDALGPLTDALDSAGRLRVDPYQRVWGHPTVLAVGDITDVKEPKQAVVAEGHAKIAAATIRSLVAGKEPAKAYRVRRAHPIVVPLGPHRGAGQLPVGDGVVIGRRMTRAIKGKDLFVPRYQRLLGRP